MSKPSDKEDFEEKIKQIDKKLSELKKKYTWMDMRTDQEKQRKIDDMVHDLFIVADLEEDHSYDPYATKISDFHPDAQAEMKKGIQDHDQRLAAIRDTYEWMKMGPSIPKSQTTISDQVKQPKRPRIAGAQVYQLLLKLKQDFPDKDEKELLAEAYRTIKEQITDFPDNVRTWYTESLTGYLDKWKENLLKYVKEGLSWEEALMRIKREERTGKERVGNEQERGDVKWKNPEDLEDERIKTFVDFSNAFHDLEKRLNLSVDDLIREEREDWVVDSIADFEEEKKVLLSEEELERVVDFLYDKWNREHNFYD